MCFLCAAGCTAPNPDYERSAASAAGALGEWDECHRDEDRCGAGLRCCRAEIETGKKKRDAELCVRERWCDLEEDE